jgi:hypothetical protein
MALNIHVLPQAGVFIGVHVVTEAPVEVHRHASQVVAATGRARTWKPPNDGHYIEPALWQASGVPKVVCARPAGRAASANGPAWPSFDAPGTVTDAVGRFLAEWAS